jgi:hypothetical protein
MLTSARNTGADEESTLIADATNRAVWSPFLDVDALERPAKLYRSSFDAD